MNSDSRSGHLHPFHPHVLLVRGLTGRCCVRALEIENALLRHQLAVLRGVKRPPLRRVDRVFLAASSRATPEGTVALLLGFTPDPAPAAHRELVKRKWTTAVQIA